MRTVLTAALIALMAFAGCLEDTDGVQEDPDVVGADEDHDPLNDGVSNQDDSGARDPDPSKRPVQNVPPAVTFAASTASGQPPFNVTFTIDAIDADDTEFTWDLDADGDGVAEVTGDSVPANYTFEYADLGNFTANLTVSDGDDATSAEILIQSVAATGGNTGPSLPGPIVFTGTGLLIPEAYGCWDGPGGGSIHDFDGALAGAWLFLTVGADITEWYAGGSFDHGGPNTGTIPAGMDGVTACGLPPGEYTITLHHPDVDPSAPAAGGEGGADDLCPTDTDAIGDPVTGLYFTPLDSVSSPGAIWIYEESNGMPGLQRNDDTVPTDCPTPDTIIF